MPHKNVAFVRVGTLTLKPNSALRKYARVRLSNGYDLPPILVKKAITYKHSTVLIRGGRVKDLPGLDTTSYVELLIRQVLKAVVKESLWNKEASRTGINLI